MPQQAAAIDIDIDIDLHLRRRRRRIAIRMPEQGLVQIPAYARRGGDQQKAVVRGQGIVVGPRDGVRPPPHQQGLHHPAAAAAGRQPQAVAGGIGTARAGDGRRPAGAPVELGRVVRVQQLVREDRMQDRFPLREVEVVGPRFAGVGREPPAQQTVAGRGELRRQRRTGLDSGAVAGVERGQQPACAVIQRGVQWRRGGFGACGGGRRSGCRLAGRHHARLRRRHRRAAAGFPAHFISGFPSEPLAESPAGVPGPYRGHRRLPVCVDMHRSEQANKKFDNVQIITFQRRRAPA